jgi:hypothetical protein
MGQRPYLTSARRAWHERDGGGIRGTDEAVLEGGIRRDPRRDRIVDLIAERETSGRCAGAAERRVVGTLSSGLERRRCLQTACAAGGHGECAGRNGRGDDVAEAHQGGDRVAEPAQTDGEVRLHQSVARGPQRQRCHLEHVGEPTVTGLAVDGSLKLRCLA